MIIFLFLLVPILILLLCMLVLVHNLYLYWRDNGGEKYQFMYDFEPADSTSGTEIRVTHIDGLRIDHVDDSTSETMILFVSGANREKYGGITTSDSEVSYDYEHLETIRISPRLRVGRGRRTRSRGRSISRSSERVIIKNGDN